MTVFRKINESLLIIFGSAEEQNTNINIFAKQFFKGKCLVFPNKNEIEISLKYDSGIETIKGYTTVLMKLENTESDYKIVMYQFINNPELFEGITTPD